MGAGLYLVYPAFYTDVSDNYRLPRGARLRTDLGGFYFNMIFALGAMALYVASGQEFLLLIVVLINLEIIHHGERVNMTDDAPQHRALPPALDRVAPQPPPGRVPPRRHRDA